MRQSTTKAGAMAGAPSITGAALKKALAESKFEKPASQLVGMVAAGGIYLMLSGCVEPRIHDAATIRPQYRLSINSVASTVVGPSGAPATPVENTSTMLVDITLEAKPSISGSSVPIVPAWICVADQSGECDPRRDPVAPFPQLGAGTWQKVVTIVAPTAGKSARYRLNLCEGNQYSQKGAPCSKLLTFTESAPFPVAARYRLRLKDVTIDQIRSPNNDTVFSTIVGDPHTNDGSCDTRCTQAFLSARSPNGSHITEGLNGVVGGTNVGPFFRVPDQDGDIWISYAMVNLGARYDDDPDRNLSRTNMLKAAVLRTVKAGLTFQQPGNYPSVELNTQNLRWAGCDGPLVGQVFILPNSGSGSVFRLTESTGASEVLPPQESPPLNMFGDGCHLPKYRVTWQLFRESR